MIQLELDYQDTITVDITSIGTAVTRLLPEIESLAAAHKARGYSTVYASLNAPFDKEGIAQIEAVIKQKKSLKPTMLIVIGIGGSSLGVRAIQQALYGALYNELNPETTIYYAESTDSDAISAITILLKKELGGGGRVLLNVISKSGTTTETVANFEYFLELLKTYQPDDYYDYVVVTSQENSPLWQYAQKHAITRLPINKNIGGRYSVFTAVGLFPLGVIGVDIAGLCKGACLAVKNGISSEPDNSAVVSAVIAYLQYMQGYTIHDLFLFSADLTGVGQWYRQLVGESLGKKHDKQGELVEIGITPTVSIGSNDLHSVAQLYLGGPRDKYTTFVKVEKNKTTIVVPPFKSGNAQMDSSASKPMHTIMDAIFQGTQRAYRNDKRPFVTLVVPEKSPQAIGYFLQFKMIEIMYMGYLFDINPFDQPQVELYKKETRKILGSVDV